ncbi:scarecrow-like protein 21 [Senna tora]|uniref:Scarecrow-like protein 21 n=1 Tax=Senna tora TaxID=362788 RepID=A0A834WEU6_9FABA|nr:scarecrow-like protein 21 [Senna tora]
MEDPEEEELLNLTLAVSASGRSERKKKGKFIPRDQYHHHYNHHIINNNNNDHNHHHHNHNNNCLSYEAKIFKLLQMREQMLRLDHHHHHHVLRAKDGGALIHLLLSTATSVDDTNLNAALDHLSDLYQTVSLTGDSVQRVVAYFADGLSARLLTRNSPFYHMLIDEPTSDEEFLAFTDLYRVSPYYQFAHFTANQAILESFEREEHRNNRALHVIDFDVPSYGFQWPSLIQSLSDKASSGNRISLRITAFGSNLKLLQDTESRLLTFAKSFSHHLVFEFQGLLRGSRVINLRKKKNETVAVNLVSYLNTLSSFIKISDTLAFVHSLNPSVVVLVEQEGGAASATAAAANSFLPRFTDALHYFAAMFDSLDDCLPLDSAERLRIERKLLGKEIKAMLNDYDVEGVDCPKYERMETWKARMESHGFVATKISSKALIQAKLLLKMRTHYCPVIQFEAEDDGGGGGGGGFRVSERDEGRAMSLGWQNRDLG